MNIIHDDQVLNDEQKSSYVRNSRWLWRTASLIMLPFTIIINGVCTAVEHTLSALLCLAVIGGVAMYSFDAVNLGSGLLFGTDRTARTKIVDQPDLVQERIQRRHEVIHPTMVAHEYAKTDGFHLILKVTQDPDHPLQRTRAQGQRETQTIEMTLNPLAKPSDDSAINEAATTKQQAQATLNTMIKAHIKEMLVKNQPRYRERLARLLYHIEERADQDIWDHAIEQTPWFVNEFYHLRADDRLMKKKMRDYLIPPDRELHRYHYNVIYDTVQCIEDVLAGLLRDSISGAQARLHEAELHLEHAELVQKLQELLPTADEMIQSMYRELEAEGMNHQYQSQILENWRNFEIEHPGTSLSYKSFMLLSVVALTSSPLIVVGATTMYLVSIGASISFNQERSQYEKTLLSQIYRIKKSYQSQTEHFVTSIYQGTLLYLQGKAIPPLPPHVYDERFSVAQTARGLSTR